MVAAGGKSSVTVSAAAECAWQASVNVNWVTLTPSSGQGAADIQVQVTPNPAPAPRQGEITLNGVKVAVSQSAASCTFEINPRSEVIPTTGGSGSVTVTSLAGCQWAATSNASWISITSGASATGPGTVRYSVAANGGSARVGTISIADQTFAVTQQAPGAPCAYTIQPTGFLGNAGRDSLRGPNYQTVDFSLAKDTKIRLLGEGGAIEFRAEAFNVFNRANFGLPINTVFSGTGPATNDVENPLAGAATITTAAPSRQIQLALKLMF